jgi:guanosine-3',5'-bis(diphosphate) 3'-pyrophosphohydrolase
VSKRLLRKFLRKNNFDDIDGLLADLALGQQLANVVAAQLVPKVKGKDDDMSSEAISIAGSEGGTVSFGNCCHPIPGDNIFGYLSAGKGIVVHRSECHNLKEFRKHPDRCLEVNWAPIVKTAFPVALRVVTKNNPGVLASISASIGEASSNIEKVEQPESNPETATLLFIVSVDDRDHLARLMRRVKRNKDVIRVTRVTT